MNFTNYNYKNDFQFTAYIYLIKYINLNLFFPKSINNNHLLAIKIINRIVDNGDTAILIEHNLDVIKCADYIIDLGPEGGENGGEIIATGTPEEVAKCDNSYTGQYIKRVLNDERFKQDSKCKKD